VQKTILCGLGTYNSLSILGAFLILIVLVMRPGSWGEIEKNPSPPAAQATLSRKGRGQKDASSGETVAGKREEMSPASGDSVSLPNRTSQTEMRR
jgi:hypothetical protein